MVVVGGQAGEVVKGNNDFLLVLTVSLAWVIYSVDIFLASVLSEPCRHVLQMLNDQPYPGLMICLKYFYIPLYSHIRLRHHLHPHCGCCPQVTLSGKSMLLLTLSCRCPAPNWTYIPHASYILREHYVLRSYAGTIVIADHPKCSMADTESFSTGETGPTSEK